MATTPDQQYLIDTKQMDDPAQCCMALGGYVEIDDEGTPMCVILDNQVSGVSDGSFYLSEACSYVEDVSVGEPSAGGQVGGGIGNWLTDNLSTLTEGFADVWGAINPISPPTYQPPTSGGGNTPPSDNKENQSKTILIAVGVVLVLILGVYLIKKK